jgi:hypothetical protein
VETNSDPAFASPIENKSGIFTSAVEAEKEIMLKPMIK